MILIHAQLVNSQPPPQFPSSWYSRFRCLLVSAKKTPLRPPTLGLSASPPKHHIRLHKWLNANKVGKQQAHWRRELERDNRYRGLEGVKASLGHGLPAIRRSASHWPCISGSSVRENRDILSTRWDLLWTITLNPHLDCSEPLRCPQKSCQGIL